MDYVKFGKKYIKKPMYLYDYIIDIKHKFNNILTKIKF